MTNQSKSTIGVFFGSRSPEHDVSIITACTTIRGLREIGFSVVPVYVSKDGKFFLGPETDDPSNETLARVDYFKDGLEKKLSSLADFSLDLSGDLGALSFESGGVFSSQRISIDLAFPCFHGPHGEDGALHGLFSLVDIPVVGPSQQASSVAMDKALTKLIYRQFGIATTDFLYFTRREWQEFGDAILADLENLAYPLFVKPARAGSSIGITRVKNEEELSEAIEIALSYDTKVVVEEGVEDVADLTVALVGDEVPEPSEIQESHFEADFFSYDDKYINDGGAQTGAAEKKVIIPAELEDGKTEEVKRLAVEIFTQFELSGIARVDFLLDRETGDIYANEINTLPGTLYKHLWEDSGISFASLLRRLVRSARSRHEREGGTNYTFDSTILAHAGEGKFGGKGGNELDDSTFEKEDFSQNEESEDKGAGSFADTFSDNKKDE